MDKSKVFIGGKLKKLSYFLLITILTLNIFTSGNCLALQNDAKPAVTQAEVTPVPSPQKTQEEQKKFQKLREESQKNVSLFSPVKVFSNLITLLMIFIAIAWLYNKYGKDYIAKAMVIKKVKQNAINVLSTAAIGQGKYLHIVEIDGEKILIGATANNISLLKELKNIQTEKVVSDEQNSTNW